MADISHKQKKFVERNYQKLSLEELARRTGLALPALRSVIERCSARTQSQRGHAGQSGPASRVHNRPAIAAAALLIFIATVAVYLPALKNDFVWDDVTYLVENSWIRRLDAQSLSALFFSFRAGNWHPLTWVSHAVDYRFWGAAPAGHHGVSIVMHACNAVLVFFLAILLLSRSGRRGGQVRGTEGGCVIAAGVTALLFGLHPVHVESVAWVAERKDLLCAFFVLLSVLAYCSYAVSASKSRYLLSLLCGIAALMSKPMAVTLPLILLLGDLYPLRRIALPVFPLSRHMPALIDKMPFVAASCVSCVITVAAQDAGGAIKSLDLFPLPLRLLNAVRAPGFYLGKILLPNGLVPFYPFPQSDEWLHPSVLLSVLAVLVITGAALWMLRRGRLSLFSAWSYYLITLIPVLGIVQVGMQAAADRYTYLPSISIFLMAGAGAVRLLERTAAVTSRTAARLLVLLPCLCLLLFLGWLTAQQIGVWRTSETLWLTVTRAFPYPRSDAVAHNNLGVAYYQKGEWDKAIAEYQKAVSLRPRYADAHNNLGAAYAGKGMLDEAIAAHKQALAIRPDLLRAHLNLGVSYNKKGELDKAIEEYKAVLALDEEYAPAHTYLAIAYYKQGNYQMAIEHCDRAAAIEGSANELLLRVLAPYRNSVP
jgi:tetratricopeptide (TPR) repeat protein